MSRAYIGIDPSLAGTAVAIIWGDGSTFTQRLATEGHEGDTAEQHMHRMDRIELWVKSRIEGVDADELTIGIEGPSLGPRHMGLDHERAGLWHRLYKRARLYVDTTVVVVTPKQRAKYATGNGNAGKAEVLSAVCARHPRAGIRTHDEADALTIAAMLARLDGHPIDDPLPKTHTAALDKLATEKS